MLKKVSRSDERLGPDHAAGFWQGQGERCRRRLPTRDPINHGKRRKCDVAAARWPIVLHSGRHSTTSKWQKRGAAMSNGPNRIMDEFAKLVTDAAGAAQGVRREVETAFKSQAERILNSMDVVQREEFEALREMTLKVRAENERLAARVAELEAKLGNSSEEVSETGAKRTTKSSSKK
ncbi:BMFP domain-containing protein YqiC [Mesorhizobium soli]|nr:BMFP domain-containing protein YqiC [Mesorhizobium soli]